MKNMNDSKEYKSLLCKDESTKFARVDDRIKQATGLKQKTTQISIDYAYQVYIDNLKVVSVLQPFWPLATGGGAYTHTEMPKQNTALSKAGGRIGVCLY